MSDSRRSDEPGLFDLPLRPEDPEQDDDGSEEPAPASTSPAETSVPGSREKPPSEELPLFPDVEEALQQEPPLRPRAERSWPRPVAARQEESEAPREAEPETEPEIALPPRRASPGRRWLAGGVDLLILLGVGLALAVGSFLLGIPIGWGELLPLGLFLLLFSFAYTVIPLAFWGQTPGMIRAGLVARSGPSEPLTFGQTALCWLGGLLTVALLGLPTLLVLFGGRSLTDRLSGSDTYQTPGR